MVGRFGIGYSCIKRSTHYNSWWCPCIEKLGCVQVLSVCWITSILSFLQQSHRSTNALLTRSILILVYKEHDSLRQKHYTHRGMHVLTNILHGLNLQMEADCIQVQSMAWILPCV